MLLPQNPITSKGGRRQAQAIKYIYICCEALLKFAVGTCVRAAGHEVAAAAGERQYGAGRNNGASQEVAEIRAAAQVFPREALVALDIENAFGAVQWADVLTAGWDMCPHIWP